MPLTLQQKLLAITRNLWWTWRPEIRSIFRDIDIDLYHRLYQNPLAFAREIDPAHLEHRAQEMDVPARIDRALRQLREHLTATTTWGMTHAGALGSRPVAYFCMEFGIHESLPIYSGGLGILAGDHIKGASNLGVPMVGVGLLYHQGYTNQVLDGSFWQQDVVEPYDLRNLPLELARDKHGNPVRVGVELPGRTVYARVLEAFVGRVRLLLLDPRDDANSPEDRELAARLYGGDSRVRIQQELLLGVGGYRALRALGITPGVLHLNEGHCAFAVLEWARHRVQHDNLDPRFALQIAGSATVFTTHTPVEAGHDRFEAGLAEEHLHPLAEGLRMPVQDVLAMGRVRPEDSGAPFLPTVLALRHARFTNGVSALHGKISKQMWQGLWPGKSLHEVPIGHITNGVHASTWMAQEVNQLFRTHIGVKWLDSIARPDLWGKVEDIDDAEVWEVKQVLKARTMRFISGRSAKMRERLGLPAIEGLDPEALTIGFGRRFVPYKRPDLVFHDLDRLDAILNNPERPLNLVFAGRAHPADSTGKELIRRVLQFCQDPRFRDRVAFIENYNIHVGRQLYQGVDAWLNNPRRPLEACGTSGMKVVLNGGLHISILDGWWAEAFDGENGFAIGNGEVHADQATQDARDAEALYRLLEEEVLPLYYDRNDTGIPHGWVRRVKRSIRTLAWRFNADRMLMDYATNCYLPASMSSSCQMS
ncbi:MAG: alpha-glucan family phosphorylase [Acidobacteria bacterium]|nr:alpha-glucan family phosphorylase [Acidobacteriota bacterium]